jgi:hypothetical protein
VLILNEKHPEDAHVLRGAMRGTPAAVHERDAYELWLAMLPTPRIRKLNEISRKRLRLLAKCCEKNETLMEDAMNHDAGAMVKKALSYSDIRDPRPVSPYPPPPIPSAQSPEIESTLQAERDCFTHQSSIVKQSAEKATQLLEASKHRPANSIVTKSVADYVGSRQELYRCIDDFRSNPVLSSGYNISNRDREIISKTEEQLTGIYFSETDYELRLLISYVDPALRDAQGKIIAPPR